MSQQTVIQINGDGVGKEVIPAARRVLEALGLPLTFVEAQAGFSTFEETGSALPSETLELCRQSDAILFGATQSPMEKVAGYQSPILALRKAFNLYANVRPAIDAVKGINILIVRENTEGLYVKQERLEDDGKTAIADRVISEGATQRIVQFACEHAMRRPRKKLTIIHKANVLKETDGLFRRVAFGVAADFPELTVAELLVDAAAMFMVMQPERFDVMVMSNLYGDILSDLAAGLTGGLGFAPSANLGDGNPSLFEPVHGSAPDIAGQGIADPRAAILSGALMLDYLGYREEGQRLRNVVFGADHLGTTEATTAAVIETLKNSGGTAI